MKVLYENFLWGSSSEIGSILVDGEQVIRGGSDPDAAREDKRGCRLYPSFVDNHCHILPTGLELLQLDLSDCGSSDEILGALRREIEVKPEGWIVAAHYDPIRDTDHPLTLRDLDKISSVRPILLKYPSNHAGLANTPALQSVSPSVVERDTNFVRDENGNLTGVVLESALESTLKAAPKPTRTEMLEAILAALQSMRDLGISIASDMQTGWFNLEDEVWAYREACERIPEVWLRLYVQWGRVYGPRGIGAKRLKDLSNELSENCRIQGLKLFADGAIGAGTAAIYGTYTDSSSPGANFGAFIYKPEVLKSRVLTASQDGWQVSVHSIGDHATDVVMDAFEATGRPATHRIEHAMMLSDSQIERLAKLNPFVCLQPQFLGRFGKTYISKLGEGPASNLIRTRSLIDSGLRVSFSSDRPITSGVPLEAIGYAVNRPSEFDPCENCTWTEGLAAYTESGAEVTGDVAKVESPTLNWVAENYEDPRERS